MYERDNELLKYICSLKRRDIDHEISTEVITRAQPVADGNNPVCRSCLKEATAVLCALNKKRCPNKRIEFILVVDTLKNII